MMHGPIYISLYFVPNIRIFVTNQPDEQFFFVYMFILILYMFRATKLLIIRIVVTVRYVGKHAYHTVTYIQ